jgi:hypothetical protein
MSIKDKYSVKSIETYLTKDWLLHKHYAKRMCSISYAFGLFKDNIMEGVCTFGSPPSRALCVGLCGEEFALSVLELNRLCVNDNLEKNTLSFFVSNYIYQATNWIYTGLSAKRTERYDINNPNKHSKSITENKNYNYNDLAVRNRPQKHRYVYFTGKKNIALKHLRYKIEPYPKGINKRYDSSFIPTTQIELF